MARIESDRDVPNVCGKVWMLDTIHNFLGTENLRQLEASSLGFMLKIADIPIQGHLILELVRKMQYCSSTLGTLRFRVNGRLIEFSKDQFALVSGLRFGRLEEMTPPLSEFYTTIFKNMAGLRLQDIRIRFMSECCINNGNSEDALKLALAYIIYGFLLRRDRSVYVDIRYLHLLDDVDTFLNYPWGTVAYQFLLSEMQTLSSHLANNVQAGDMLIHGFAVALQVWAYEVFPNIGKALATKMDWRSDGFPRLMHWCTVRRPSRKAVRTLFTPKGGFEMNEIQMSEDEARAVRALRIGQICPITVPPAKGKRLARKLEFENGPLVHEVPRSSRHSISESPPENDVGRLSHRPASQAKKRKRVSRPKNPPSPLPAASSTLKRKHHLTEQVGDNNLMLSVTDLLKSVREVMEICMLNNRILMGIKKEFEIMKERGGHEKRAPPHKYPSAAAHQRARFDKTVKSLTRIASYRAPTTTTLPKPHMYDPSHYDHECDDLLKSFLAWYEYGSTSQRIRISCDIVGSVDKQWFGDIWQSDHTLCDEHIDALTSLLLSKRMMYPEKFMKRWTVMEHMCWAILSNDNYLKGLDNAMGYVLGSYPSAGGLAWIEVDSVYGVAHVNGNHWVAYELRFLDKRIVIYDSLSESISQEAVIEQFSNFARAITLLCMRGEVLDNNKGSEIDFNCRWHVVYSNTQPPQQSNEYDCGIMAIKFIECLSSGQLLSIVDPARCGVFRKQYCAELFRSRRIEG